MAPDDPETTHNGAPPAAAELAFGHFLVPRREDGGPWELGRGAMGVTYRAFDTSLRTEVALKVIRAEQVANEEVRRRFQREARAAAKIRHPNVASVLYLGEQDGEFFYAMEFIAGRTLAEFIKEAAGPLPPVVAVALAAQAAAALNAAHKREVVHRDLKPGNLMLLEGPAVDHEDERTTAAGNRLLKMIDFGLARSFGENRQEESFVTQAFSGFIGTPAYASPEQCTGGNDLDGRSDLYSLGVILWQMLAGRLPFTGGVVEVLGKHQFQPPPVAQLAAVPAPVVALVMGLLAKDPAERQPQTAGLLRTALDRCLRDLLAAPATVATPAVPSAAPGDIERTVETTITPTVGTTLLARYRLGREVAEGNGGKLFLAADQTGHDRPVALKLLPAERLAHEPGFRETVENALRTARQHPHPALLAHVGGLERSGSSAFYVRAWAEGFSLDELLRARQGGLRAAEAVRLLDALPAALDFAHAHAFTRLELALRKLFVVPVDGLTADDWPGLRTRPVTDWPTFHLKLNPLGFPPAVGVGMPAPELTLVMTHGDDGHSDAANPVAALARLIRELLDASRDGLGPVAALNDAANAVLRRALATPAESGGPGPHGAPFADAASFWRTLTVAAGLSVPAGEPDMARTGDPSERSSGCSHGTPLPCLPRTEYGNGVPWLQPEKGGGEGKDIHHRDRATTIPARRHRLALAAGLALCALAVVGGLAWWHHAATAGAGPGPAAAAEKSIAVLPFDNLSDDKANAFFTEGIQDEILTNLAKVADLKVISRTSVMAYGPGHTGNVRDIGLALGVAHLLEGSVQRAGGKIRVTAQLIDARTDAQQWAEHFDRDLADVFAIQSEMAERIAASLQARLSPGEKTAIDARPTADLAAYDAYVQAKDLVTSYQGTPDWRESLLKAVRGLDEATARDPNFALAYCLAARAHDQLYFFGLDPTPARVTLEENAAATALRLQPGLGEAHLAQALLLYHGKRDYPGARRELAVARAALPNAAEVFSLTSYLDRREGHWDDAARNQERATSLDPRNPSVLNDQMVIHDMRREYRDEIRVAEAGVRVAPSADAANFCRLIKAAALLEAGQLEAARAAMATVPPDYDSNGGAMFTRVLIALYEHRPAEAAALVESFKGGEYSGVNGLMTPRAWLEALVARAAGDPDRARAALLQARGIADATVRRRPDDPGALALLGQIDAGLGRKEDAWREGRAAVAMRPVSADAMDGPGLATGLAMIYAWTGDTDVARAALVALEKTPGGPDYGQLRFDPAWDPLRGKPGFAEMLARLDPHLAP